MIITELSSLTKPKKYDAVIGGNIKISTQILQDVVNYNNKFSNSCEAVAANVEVRVLTFMLKGPVFLLIRTRLVQSPCIYSVSLMHVKPIK